MKENGYKLFRITKYVKARSVAEAVQKDKKAPVDGVWIDEEWKKEKGNLADAVGFSTSTESDDE